jgi:hypothetical protein
MASSETRREAGGWASPATARREGQASRVHQHAVGGRSDLCSASAYRADDLLGIVIVSSARDACGLGSGVGKAIRTSRRGSRAGRARCHAEGRGPAAGGKPSRRTKRAIHLEQRTARCATLRVTGNASAGGANAASTRAPRPAERRHPAQASVGTGASRNRPGAARAAARARSRRRTNGVEQLDLDPRTITVARIAHVPTPRRAPLRRSPRSDPRVPRARTRRPVRAVSRATPRRPV